MCGCAAAVARAIAAFLDAVLRCFLSWFRSSSSPVLVRRHRDPLVHRDLLGEVLSDAEKGIGGNRGSRQHRKHGPDIDEELRQKADYRKLCCAIPSPAQLLHVSSEEITNDMGNISGIGGTSDSGLDEDVTNFTPTLPKAWDGNGIPNTVTKYKEDQKVPWHNTPFEERVLRVLGESNPPRKLNSENSFQVQDDSGIPNATTKYKEDQMVIKLACHAVQGKTIEDFT